MTVRRATPDDRDQVVATVVAAFEQDPAWAFMHPDDYARTAPLFAGTLFDVRVERGTVVIEDDGSAVSMWEEPGGPPAASPATAAAWERFREEAGGRVWQRLQEYDAAVEAVMEAVMPSEPFWYLGVLATRPDRQRQGLAHAVTAPVLEHADVNGLDVCLETSTPANLAVYARMGFEQMAEIHIPGGPATWWLRRAPEARGA